MEAKKGIDMLFSQKFNAKKLFSSIRFFDGLPVVHEDLHQLQDRNRLVQSLLTSKMAKQGFLGKPKLIIDGNTIKLGRSILNLEGDLYIVNSSEGPINIPIRPYEEPEGSRTDLIFLEGFFREITSNTNMHEYGGLDNPVIPADLVHEGTGIQVSTRYQFQWRIRVAENTSKLSDVKVLDPNGEETNLLYQEMYSDDGEVESYVFYAEDPIFNAYKNRMYAVYIGEVTVDSNGITDVHVEDNLLFSQAVLGHIEDKNNPHNVTPEQIGAVKITGGNVTGDLYVKSSLVLTENNIPQNHTIKQLKQDIVNLGANLYDLMLESYYSGKLTDKQGMILDGFADSTRTDMFEEELTIRASAGSTSLYLSGINNLSVGQEIVISDEKGEETAVVSSIDSIENRISIEEPLKRDYPSGSYVTKTNGEIDTLNRQFKSGYHKVFKVTNPVPFLQYGATQPTSPHFVVDENGNQHIVFESYQLTSRARNIGYVVFKEDGTTSPVEWITTDVHSEYYNPRIAIGPNGDKHIVFTKSSGGRLNYTRIRKDGSRLPIYDIGAGINPDIFVDNNNGTVHITHLGAYFSGKYPIEYVRVSEEGSIEKKVTVGHTYSAFSSPRIVVDSKEQIKYIAAHITNEIYSQDTIVLLRVDHNDNVLEPIVVAEGNSEVSYKYPSICIDSKKVVHIAYPSTNRKISYVKFNGVDLWSTIVDPMSSVNIVYIDLVVDSNDTGCVVFFNYTGRTLIYNISYFTVTEDNTVSSVENFRELSLAAPSSTKVIIKVDSWNRKHILTYTNQFLLDKTELCSFVVDQVGKVSEFRWIRKPPFLRAAIANSMRAVEDAQGNRHIVFPMEYSNYYRIFYLRVNSEGEVTSFKMVTQHLSANSVYPDIAVDSEGTKHIVYQYQVSESRYVINYVRLDYKDDLVYEDTLLKDNDKADSRMPSIALHIDGTVWVAFQSTGFSAYGTTYFNAVLVKITGDTFTTRWVTSNTTSGNSNHHGLHCQVAVDTAGNPVVVYTSHYVSNTVANIRMSYLNDSTGVITHVNITNSTVYKSTHPYIYIDGMNRKHIVYRNALASANTHIPYYALVGSDNTVKVTRSFTEFTKNTYPTSVKMYDSSGHVYVAFMSYDHPVSADSNVWNVGYIRIFVSSSNETLVLEPKVWITGSKYSNQEYPEVFAHDQSADFVFLSMNQDKTYPAIAQASAKASTEISALKYYTRSLNLLAEDHYDFSLCLDKQDNKHILFISKGYDESSENIGYLRVSPDGECSEVVWVTKLTGLSLIFLNTVLPPHTFPQIVVDKNGVKHILFVAAESESSYKVGYVKVSETDVPDNDPVWIFTSSNTISNLRIAMSENGVLMGVFHSTSGSVSNIGCFTIDTSGNPSDITWLTQSSTSSSTSPSIVYDEMKNIFHVVFSSNLPGRESIGYVRVLPDRTFAGGVDWINAITWVTYNTSGSNTSSHKPEILLDKMGTRHVAWVKQTEGSDMELQYTVIRDVNLVGALINLRGYVFWDLHRFDMDVSPDGTVIIHSVYGGKENQDSRGIYAMKIRDYSVVESYVVESESNTSGRSSRVKIDSRGVIFAILLNKKYNGTNFSGEILQYKRTNSQGKFVIEGGVKRRSKSYYYSKRIKFPLKNSTAKLWVTRKVEGFDYVAEIVDGGRTIYSIRPVLPVKEGDFIEIYDPRTGFRERAQVLSVEKGVYRLVEPLQNSYSENSLIEVVSVKPQIFIGSNTDPEHFEDLVFVSSVQKLPGIVEDYYEFESPVAGSNVKLKLILENPDPNSVSEPAILNYGLLLGL